MCNNLSQRCASLQALNRQIKASFRLIYWLTDRVEWASDDDHRKLLEKTIAEQHKQIESLLAVQRLLWEE